MKKNNSSPVPICEIFLSQVYNELCDQSSSVECISQQVDALTKLIRERRDFHITSDIVWKNIFSTVSIWVGYTYVGRKKPENLKLAFHNFYGSLFELLRAMKESDIDNFRSIASEALYQGVVYRYIGSTCANNKKRIPPIFDSIYVSWCKNPRTPYFESKFHGPITILSSHIAGDLYGIDLDAFGVGRKHEAEVIFPTMQNCVIDVEYIDR